MSGLAKRGNPRSLSRLVHGFMDAILITNNQKHLQRVKALQCENWVR